jgi:hypothetical protein
MEATAKTGPLHLMAHFAQAEKVASVSTAAATGQIPGFNHNEHLRFQAQADICYKLPRERFEWNTRARSVPS